MKIIWWNIRGLNDLNRRDIVKKKVRDWRPSILLLQETKLQRCTDLIAWQCWGNKNMKWIDSPSQGSSGILCMWDSSQIEVLDFLMGPYSIIILCKTISSSFEWMFTGIYAPCASYNDEVSEFGERLKKSNGSASTIGMKKLIKFISKHQLIDLPLIGASFTWTNKQLQSVRSRIDRILVTLPWELEYPNVIQQALPRPVSDHIPISLICDGLKRGPSPFHCEYYWFTHPDFVSLIKNWWESFSVSGNAGFVFCKKLQLLKQKLREWSKREYGDLERRLEELEDTFNNLDIEENFHNSLSPAQWDERVAARQEWYRLTLIKAEKWKNIARVNDIKNNENNTKYFHILANDHRRISYIGSIKVNGVVTSDGAKIKNGIIPFFKDIFKANSHRRISIEVSGPYGFPISFYLLCWDIIKDDFFNVVKDLHARSFLDWRLKNTFIALIPKKDTIEEIKDLRPISLIHGVYKIISKMLEESLKTTLLNIISQHQTAFIKKRQILDGVLIENELIDLRLKSGTPGLLCKVDFEKTFDHVNWDFIDDIFNLMGCGDKWRSWIRCCVEFVKFSVLINGSAYVFFTSDKGMLISHLQFADDTLIFLDADSEQIKNLRLILISYELLTSLKINFSKSQIFGVGFEGDLSQFCDILGCCSGSLLTTYLGLSLGDKSRGVAKMDKVIEKFIARLAG
ncbi:uncharacterized protein LOC113359946 [Papaver somniferum]|uniref:uncharacterized protein LOC113359946 n=1 Tax=Papaver somniferum TaxID=3469 RepID=UPI000E702A33|nr:uncharacterized protein LOC113359946 [Papaver somniferum]